MLFLVGTIACIVIAYAARRCYEDGILITSLLAGFVIALLTLFNMSSGTQPYRDAKEKQENAAEQWYTSAQTDEDWEWVLEQMSDANEMIRDCAEDKTKHILLDASYLVSNRDTSDYLVVISEDKIVFPDSYSMLPLRKEGAKS